MVNRIICVNFVAMEMTIELLEEKYDEYNEMYFDGKLPRPNHFGLLKSFKKYGEFRCNSHAPGSKLFNVTISISCYYIWDEKHLRDVLCHEMLHYKCERSKNVEEDMHGQMFVKAAEEMNKKYGLNISARYDTALPLKASKNAPKFSLARLLYVRA